MMNRLLVVLLFLATSTLAFAQKEKGSIEGVVEDRQGAFLTGATVLLVDLRTLQCHKTETDSAGRYRFADLKPGRYQVLVGAQYFETKVRILKVKPNRSVDFSPKLDIGRDVKMITALGFRSSNPA